MTKREARCVSVCTVITAMQPLVARDQVAGYRAGQTIQLAADVTVRVLPASIDAFQDVGLNGVGHAFELDFAKGAGRIVVIEPSNDPANSGVVLRLGTTPVAPKALAVRQSTKPEREVTTVDALARNRANGRGAWFGFSVRPNVQFLFDVPKGIVDKPVTLAVEILLDGKPPPIRIEIAK